jgi:hypothetical protein
MSIPFRDSAIGLVEHFVFYQQLNTKTGIFAKGAAVTLTATPNAAKVHAGTVYTFTANGSPDDPGEV